MKRFFLIYISLFAICVQAENKITGYRYWFNQDITTHVTGNFTAQTDVHLETIIQLENIPHGINKFTIQFTDSEMKYSAPLTTFFYKMPVGSSEKSLITGYRYWLNNDTTATVVNISPAAEENITAQLNLDNAVNQVNIFRFQTIDEKNLWSVPVTAFIFGRQNLKMQKYQYWFNNNIKDAVTAQVGNDRSLFLNLPVNTTHLNDGFNILNLRFADDLEMWSSTLTQFFYKSKAATGENNQVKSVEYWFDNDIAGAVKTDLQPKTDIVWLGSLSADGVSAGLHRINVRFADERAYNSQVTSAFFFKPTNEKYDHLVIDKIRYLIGNNFPLLVINTLQQAMAAVSYNDELDLTNFRGMHAPLLVQFADTRGLWSIPTTDSVLVPVNVGFEPILNETICKSFKVFPNPNKGEFIIDPESEIENGIISITDISGRIYFNYQGKISRNTRIQQSGISTGLYFVSVQNLSTNNSAKYIKMIIDN